MDYEMRAIEPEHRPKITWKDAVNKDLRSL